MLGLVGVMTAPKGVALILERAESSDVAAELSLPVQCSLAQTAFPLLWRLATLVGGRSKKAPKLDKLRDHLEAIFPGVASQVMRVRSAFHCPANGGEAGEGEEGAKKARKDSQSKEKTPGAAGDQEPLLKLLVVLDFPHPDRATDYFRPVPPWANRGDHGVGASFADVPRAPEFSFEVLSTFRSDSCEPIL